MESGRPRPVDPPRRSTLEEVGNAVTHGVGALLSVIALFLMLGAAQSAGEYLGAVIYFLGLLSMFLFSCLYHSFRHGLAVKRLLRRFDYSSIYIVIGATFAPIVLAYTELSFGRLFFVLQWSVIALGVILTAVLGPARLRFVSVPIYLLLGWCGLMFLPEMYSRADYTLMSLVLGGGVIYSLGLIPYARRSPAAHFIWHIFVLLGAIVQWLGIYLSIYLK